MSTQTRTRILDAALACTGRGLTMAGVAVRAGLSRQAVYLHFPGRSHLLAALAEHAVGPLEQRLAAIAAAPSARVALAGLIADLAAMAGLDDPSDDRLALCAALVERFRTEGELAPHRAPDAARDLLWSLTSPALWQELVTGRGWSAERYRNHIGFLAVGVLTR